MKESWICFCDSDNAPFKILKKGFRHVFVISRDDYNWYVIDPDWRYLSIKILEHDIDHNVPKELSKKLTVLHVKHSACTKRYLCMPWKLFSCVGIIKYALGLSFWSFTPYRLYKRLKKLENKTVCKKYTSIFYVNEIKED